MLYNKKSPTIQVKLANMLMTVDAQNGWMSPMIDATTTLIPKPI